MAARGHILYRGGEPRSFPELVNKSLGEGIRAAADHWHQRMMPGHFEPSALRKYNYTPRSGDNEPPRLPVKRQDGTTTYRANPHYSWRKRRQKRHNRPLVWSGASELDAKASVRLSLRVAAGGRIEARAAMNMPRYFYKYRKDAGNRIDKADELTRTTPAEQVELRDVVDRYVAERTAGMNTAAHGRSVTF